MFIVSWFVEQYQNSFKDPMAFGFYNAMLACFVISNGAILIFSRSMIAYVRGEVHFKGTLIAIFMISALVSASFGSLQFYRAKRFQGTNIPKASLLSILYFIPMSILFFEVSNFMMGPLDMVFKLAFGK